ncbi:MAG: fumarylacetoacetate hydrolase family protein, partial [Streptosporangiales bacterium]|nr:fumarylacetoacetate hydrolase family protein [Streptosporangiales bacterium]
MKLASFNDGRVGVVEGDRVTEITLDPPGPGLVPSPMRRLIESAGGRSPGELPRGKTYPLNEVTLLAPVTDPSKILAAPVNYRDHQQEMNEAVQVSGLGLFLKARSSLAGSGERIVLPYSDRRFDQEGELAAIVGRTARFVAPADALDYVFGYTGLLDITMRGGEDRSIRKSFETFTPTGPWITTANEFGSPSAVDLTCAVSGEVRQSGNTRDLIWDVARLVSYASSVTTLHPGDVITTGTPAGVGPIRDGDTVELTIAGIGAPLRL